MKRPGTQRHGTMQSFQQGNVFRHIVILVPDPGAIDLRPVILEVLRRLDQAGNNEEFLALLKQKVQK